MYHKLIEEREEQVVWIKIIEFLYTIFTFEEYPHYFLLSIKKLFKAYERDNHSRNRWGDWESFEKIDTCHAPPHFLSL